MKKLKLHYQVTKLAAADCSQAMCRTYDIEVWIPSMGIYKESDIISHKLIKLCLKLRRTNVLHLNIFNIAWNKKESDGNMMVYHSEIARCMELCKLTKNIFYERCYRRELA